MCDSRKRGWEVLISINNVVGTAVVLLWSKSYVLNLGLLSDNSQLLKGYWSSLFLFGYLMYNYKYKNASLLRVASQEDQPKIRFHD